MKLFRGSTFFLAFISFFVLTDNPVNAEEFNVYCVPSNDGVSTCSGWSDGGTLTCVSSPGGVASCKSSTGQQFTCVQDGSGVTTCKDPAIDGGSSTDNDDCTYIGNGSFNCVGRPKNSPDLIPSPNAINDIIDIPNPSINGDTSIPSLMQQ